MASIKVKFRPSTVADHEGSVYYQIIHNRKIRQLPTDYKVFTSEWDGNRSMVTTAHNSNRRPLILSIRERIRWDVERITKIVRTLDNTSLEYSAEDVIEEFRKYSREYSLFNFMEGIIATLKQEGKTGTSLNYRYALNSFKLFRKKEDIMLDNITPELMTAYETWQRNRGLSPNSISFYFRILRAVYNRAVEQNVMEDRNPFRRVYTGIEKTIKRALPLSAIKKIRNLDFSMSPSLAYARDMFIMSFYLRGMSFIDMAFLKKSDLRNGYVTYRRRKTNQRLTIEWTKEMQTLIEKYPENNSDYLIPIIKNKGINERCAYRNAEYTINRNLKKVAVSAGIEIPLTMYVARHSWASAAKAKGIPLNVISEGLGHDSETTTQIYLANLDMTIVDRANSLILSDL